MERRVKERLIGAAVLVAAAVILIPEMLSGPDRKSEQAPVPVASDVPLKTYTIDLNRSPTSSATAATDTVPNQVPPSESAPAPEMVQASRPTEAQATPESTPVQPAGSASAPASAAASVQSAPPASKTAPSKLEHVQPAPAPQVKAPATTVSAAPESRPVATSGWVVQLGSFSNQAAAAKLARDYRSDGYDTFVMPVKSGSNTLYRVRIGPVGDRDAAAKILGKVKDKVPGAAVVRHP